eukprot:EG_transcript_10533
MDELARVRAEQARKYAQEKAQHGPPEAAAASSCASRAKRGKVVCGKWFLDPPQKLTVKDMEALLSVYVRVAPQKEAFVAQIRMDTDAAEFFQSFLVRAGFAVQRYGVMFGSFDPQAKVVTVDFIYEPKQASGSHDWAELEDPMLDTAVALAKHFGLVPVGWIFSYRHDRGDYILSAREVLKTADFAAKYGPHCVVVGVTNLAGGTQTDFSPWQVSNQLVQIYREGTLSPHPTEAHLVHSERELEAVKEETEKGGRSHVLREPTHDVDTALVTIPVPVAAHKSAVCRNRFGRLNRPDHRPTLQNDVRNVLQTRRDEPFWQVLTDLHLLMCLLDAGVIDLARDVATICAAIARKDDSLLAPIKQKVLQASTPSTSNTAAVPKTAPAGKQSDVQQVMSVCHCSRTEAENALAMVGGNVETAIELLIG